MSERSSEERKAVDMTCYMRHMHWLFDVLDRPYSDSGRREMDRALRQVLGLDESLHCPEVWSAIKGLTSEERDGLPARLSEVLE